MQAVTCRALISKAIIIILSAPEVLWELNEKYHVLDTWTQAWPLPKEASITVSKARQLQLLANRPSMSTHEGRLGSHEHNDLASVGFARQAGC